MLLKKADDKSKRIALLEDLQKSTMLDFRQKKWLREELSRFRKGIQGEQDSAYYLDQHFKDGGNHVVLHDLRFEFEGDVAQIDHLVIARISNFYLIETKNYAGNVSINASGEFTAEYGDDRFGVPSPIEQSRRHERILRKLLERLEIAGRFGTAPEFQHVVMFHPKAIITRPKPSEFDTSGVIKADQFPSWHAKFVDKIGVGTLLLGAANNAITCDDYRVGRKADAPASAAESTRTAGVHAAQRKIGPRACASYGTAAACSGRASRRGRTFKRRHRFQAVGMPALQFQNQLSRRQVLLEQRGSF